jgi:hypothetical protein
MDFSSADPDDAPLLNAADFRCTKTHQFASLIVGTAREAQLSRPRKPTISVHEPDGGSVTTCLDFTKRKSHKILFKNNNKYLFNIPNIKQVAS